MTVYHVAQILLPVAAISATLLAGCAPNTAAAWHPVPPNQPAPTTPVETGLGALYAAAAAAVLLTAIASWMGARNGRKAPTNGG